jgi:Tfp pilus assembly protein PilN
MIAFAVCLVLELAACGFFYVQKQQELSKLQDKLESTQNDVKQTQKKVEEAADYEKKAKKLRSKLEVLHQIEEQSVGPVHVLEELQTILSPPENPEERYAQSQKNWNVEWNPRHLWIKTLTEKQGSFEMVGQALDADDVAEFLHRLETAKHFQNVQLDYVRPSKKQARGTKVVEFRVTGGLTYRTSEKSKKTGKGS